MLALSKSSEYIVPSWSKGGIDDLLSGEINDLRVVHQSLEVSVLFFNLLAKLSKRDFLDCRIAVTTSFLICLNLAQRAGDCERFAFRNARFLFLISFLIYEFINVGSEGLILMILFGIQNFDISSIFSVMFAE